MTDKDKFITNFNSHIRSENVTVRKHSLKYSPVGIVLRFKLKKALQTTDENEKKIKYFVPVHSQERKNQNQTDTTNAGSNGNSDCF